MRLIDKYQPRKLSDLVGQESALKEVLAWLAKPGNKGLLAYGPPGTGKTATAHALAIEKGLEVVEMNASDFRDEESIRGRLVNASVQASLFATGKLILVDEVDGLAGRTDSGAANAIIELIQTSRYPVFLTCNDNWATSVRSLKPYVKEVEFKRPRTDVSARFLKDVADAEGLNIRQEAVLQIALQKDLRSALLDLEALASTPNAGIAELESLGYRNRDKSVFEALRDIFKARTWQHARGALEGLNMDIKDLVLWLDENMMREYEGDTLARGFDALSRADVFMGRIKRRQDWSLLKYTIDLSTIGVAIAKAGATGEGVRQGFISYRPSKYLQTMTYSRNKRLVLNGLLKKIAGHAHTSTRTAWSYMPVLKGMASQGIRPFDLSESELQLLKEG